MLCNFLMSYSSASSRMSSSPSLDLQSSGSEYLPDPETKRRGRRRRSPFELTSEESLDTAAPPECQTLPARRKRKRTKFGCSLCPAVVINLLRHLREVHEVGVQKNVTSKTGYKYRICPMANCGRYLARLKIHLKRVHHLRDEDAERYFLQADTVTRPASPAKEGYKKMHISLRHDLNFIAFSTSQLFHFLFLRKKKRKRRNPPSSPSTSSSTDKEPPRKKQRGRVSRLTPATGATSNRDRTREQDISRDPPPRRQGSFTRVSVSFIT